MAQQTFSGTVKFFDRAKGFGFIIPKNGDSNNEIFFHATNVREEDGVREGDNVNYEVGKNKKGVCATNVTKRA